jgi:hypothetical protein
MRIRLFFAAVALAATAFAQAPKPEDSITAEGLKAHVRFLSDDLLEGRGTGTRGHEIAARYSAAQFESMGLKPGGDNGTFFQAVHLRQAIFNSEQSTFSLTTNGNEDKMVLEQDWFSAGDYLRTDTSAEGQVVFVGFGLTAPELKHDRCLFPRRACQLGIVAARLLLFDLLESQDRGRTWRHRRDRHVEPCAGKSVLVAAGSAELQTAAL